MARYIYQICVSNPWKTGDPSIDNMCFSEESLAVSTLLDFGFGYSAEAELWHNGATEAWITKREIRTKPLFWNSSVSFAKEEVQLR